MKTGKSKRKLTRVEFANMWGEDGPYSEVRRIEETRILDDRVSRVFLIVEITLNPFTYEYATAHLGAFARDPEVLSMLAHAENRGKFGYSIGAGSIERGSPGAEDFIARQVYASTQTVIRLHQFIIAEFGLQKSHLEPLVRPKRPTDSYVWNEAAGVVPVSTRLSTFYTILPFAYHGVLKDIHPKKFALLLADTCAEYNTDLSDITMVDDYALLSVRTVSEESHEGFINALVSRANALQRIPWLRTETHTQTTEPTAIEIFSFLSSVSKN